MKISPLYRAVLTACPDLSWIYNFKAQLGRGRCPWVHGLTKTGQKISRFLKKGLIKAHTWLNDSEIVSTSRDRIYEVYQDECTCPEWKYRINKNKGYRHIPGLFKGKVDLCKHQVEHWLRSHDVSNFSSFIEVKKNQTPTQNSQQTYQVDCVNIPDGISIEYQPYWEDFQTFDVYYKGQIIGEIEVTPDGDETSTVKGFRHLFPTQESAIAYLLKQNNILLKEEQRAMRDLFGDDMYSEQEPEYPMQEYFEQEKILEEKAEPQTIKPKKKWLSFSDLTG